MNNLGVFRTYIKIVNMCIIKNEPRLTGDEEEQYSLSGGGGRNLGTVDNRGGTGKDDERFGEKTR